MKTLLLLLLPILFLPLTGFAQTSPAPAFPQNSFMITPLGNTINDSKSSIYYMRIVQDSFTNYIGLRFGTELFNTINVELANDEEIKASIWNIKAGIELGKRIGKTVVYVGPEVSYSKATVTGATLSPTGNAIFSSEAIFSQQSDQIDETTLSLFSLIGFVGVKYRLTGAISVGIESALGFGWFNTEQSYISNRFSGTPADDRNTGTITDISAARFILLEYAF